MANSFQIAHDVKLHLAYLTTLLSAHLLFDLFEFLDGGEGE
jgi:hypothetical protein